MKKTLRPPELREAVEYLVAEHGMSVVRACGAVKLARSAFYRVGADLRERDGPVMVALNGLVDKHGRWGFWKCFDALRRQGHFWNHKWVWRVYCEMRLNLPRRAEKRLPKRLRQPLVAPMEPNQIWAVDFMHDSLMDGRRFRTFNVLDEGAREGLAIEGPFLKMLVARHFGWWTLITAKRED